MSRNPEFPDALPRRAAVLGGGSFGTALAQLLATNGMDTTLWVRDPAVAHSINERHENPVYLPGIPLSPRVRAELDLATAVADVGVVMLTIPSQFLRGFIQDHRDRLPVGVPLVGCAKGIENDSLQTPHEMLLDELPGKYHPFLACLSGPSFASEVARGMPTNVVVAAACDSVALRVQRIVHGHTFRAYISQDVMGVEIGGAVKNVIAVAAGACDGLGYGDNARAGLMTRGLAEMTRLAQRKGAQPLTLAGLAGMGDLVLTCAGAQSRNRSVGLRLGRGEPIGEILASMRMVAEGVATSRSVHQLAENLGVDMPITREVYQVIHEGKPVARAVRDLLARPATHE